MGDQQQVLAKVQQILVDGFRGVTLEKGNEFSLRHGSSRAFVRVVKPSDNPDAPVFVKITIPLLIRVRDDAALREHIAFHSDDYMYGHLSLYKDEDAETHIYLTHNLLGDYLDEAELGTAVAWMLGTADDLDDELQAQFGGEKFHDE